MQMDGIGDAVTINYFSIFVNLSIKVYARAGHPRRRLANRSMQTQARTHTAARPRQPQLIYNSWIFSARKSVTCEFSGPRIAACRKNEAGWERARRADAREEEETFSIMSRCWRSQSFAFSLCAVRSPSLPLSPSRCLPQRTPTLRPCTPD